MPKFDLEAPGALYSIMLFQKKGYIRSFYGIYVLFGLLLIWDSIYLISFPPLVMAVWTVFICSGAFVIKHMIDQGTTRLLSIYLIISFFWWGVTVFFTGGWDSPIFYFAGILLILYALSGSLLLNSAGAVLYTATVLFSGFFQFPSSGNFVLPLSIIGVNALTIAGGFLISYALHHYEKSFSHLKKKVYTDYLTGLFNREGFLLEWDRNRLAKGIFAVMDLNQFKQINDNMGHDAGDKVLQLVGRKLKKHLPDSSLIGRIGGDEFILYLPYAESLQEARQQVDSIIRTAGKKAGIPLSASIGMLHISSNNQTFRELYKSADADMYVHKRLKQQDRKES